MQMAKYQVSFFLIRFSFLFIVLSLAFLLLGPFQGAEKEFGLLDTQAHVVAFYCLGVMSLMAVPNVRKSDLFIYGACFAALSEVLQAAVGRSASFIDFGADLMGLLAVFLPIYAADFRGGARSSDRRQKAMFSIQPKAAMHLAVKDRPNGQRMRHKNFL